MNKASSPAPDEMRPEYDFSHGARGKYAKRYAAGTNIIVLEPDVAKWFPDSATVNQALRALVEVAKRQPSKSRASRATSSRNAV